MTIVDSEWSIMQKIWEVIQLANNNNYMIASYYF